MTTAERELFETWVSKRYGFDPVRKGDGYCDFAMNDEWEAWHDGWQARAGYAAPPKFQAGHFTKFDTSWQECYPCSSPTKCAGDGVCHIAAAPTPVAQPVAWRADYLGLATGAESLFTTRKHIADHWLKQYNDDGSPQFAVTPLAPVDREGRLDTGRCRWKIATANGRYGQRFQRLKRGGP